MDFLSVFADTLRMGEVQDRACVTRSDEYVPYTMPRAETATWFKAVKFWACGTNVNGVVQGSLVQVLTVVLERNGLCVPIISEQEGR